MSQVLFNRDWAVTIGISGNPGKKYTDLKVVFDIEKNSVGSSNKAKVEIYNLSTLSRQQYQQPDVPNLRSTYQLQLEAGYAGNRRTIYLGDIRTAKNRRVGPDIITTFECGSGEKQLVNAVIDKTYPAGTTVVTVLQDLAQALQVDIGSVLGIKADTYNNGLHLTGSVKKNLDQITSKLKMQWSVQDGRLQIYPIGAHIGRSAIIVSNQRINSVNLTGLIGVPSQNQGLTQFISLLNPNIMPGALVQIYSETIKGNFFRVNKAHFEGDSHGDKWQVTCEAAPINETQVIPQAQGDNFSTAVIV